LKAANVILIFFVLTGAVATINWNILFEFCLAVHKPTSADELYWELLVAAIGYSTKGPGY
jgi:hypothetical protein